MNLEKPIWDVIVIGAGMSGLAARRTLIEQGLSVLTLEKSRGLGGRASTRRMGGICADLGAQFTSAQKSYWRDLLEAAQNRGVTPFLLHPNSQHARYVNSFGMSRLSRILVEDPLNSQSPIQRETKVAHLKSAGSGARWEVIDHAAQSYFARAVILTSPLPQAMEFITHQSEITLDEPQRQRLNELKYNSCLSAAFILARETALPRPGILKQPSVEISGIFEQRKKGLSTSSPTVVVQAAPNLSQKLWEEPTDTILTELWNQARIATDNDLLPQEFITGWLQKWRYCEPLQRIDADFEKLLVKQAAPLVLAGDAFGGSKIEGAIESGRRAGLFVGKCLGKAKSLAARYNS